MIRTSHSIATRFDSIGKTLENLILSQLEASREKQYAILQKISDQFGKHADAINNQSRRINALHQLQQKENSKLLKLVSLYTDLASCSVMDGKRKETLKTEITNLINTQ